MWYYIRGGDIMQRTSDKIKYYRKEKGLTQKELSARAGIPTISLQQYESGARCPKIETLQKIAKALEVPVNNIRSDGDLWADDMISAVSNTLVKPMDDLARLQDSFMKLNDEGRNKANEYVDDLAKIPQYQKHED